MLRHFSLRPLGIQVKGSKPWFCKKKTMRFGLPDGLFAEKALPQGRLKPALAATPAIISLRVSMAVLPLEQVSHLWSYSRMKNCQKKWFFLATIFALL